MPLYQLNVSLRNSSVWCRFAAAGRLLQIIFVVFKETNNFMDCYRIFSNVLQR